jgi:hypothetical protein
VDLLILKLLANRMIDRADVVALLQANHEQLDFPYLNRWTERLSLTELLPELWQHALPGHSRPK